MAASDQGRHKPQVVSPQAPRCRKAEGFGLLEVLVATTLMGLVLVVLLQVLTASLRCQGVSWGHTLALLEAEKVLQENCELTGLTEGTFQGREGDYDYQVRVVPQYEISDPLAGKHIMCSIIQVTVTWKEWGRPIALTLQTVRTGVPKKS